MLSEALTIAKRSGTMLSEACTMPLASRARYSKNFLLKHYLSILMR
jgi:hypothetical protein